MNRLLPFLLGLFLTSAGCGDDGGATCLDLECGAATCEVVTDIAECVCPVGYVFESASLDCLLDVLPADVGFDDPRWTITGGTVDSTSGDVVFGLPSSCEDIGVATEVGLPEATLSGRSLVLDIEYISGDCDVQGSCVWDAIGVPFLTLDGRTLPVQDSGDGAMESSYCLGPAFESGATATLAYGIDAFVRNMPCAGAPYWLERISSVAIREAELGECLETPGLEDAADFPDLSMDGWEVIDLHGSMNPPAAHGLVMDAGGDYYSATISSAYMNRIGQNAVQLRREVNVPESGTGLAIAVDLRTDIDMEWGLRLGDSDGLSISHGTWSDESMITRRLLCVPERMRGTITELSVFLGSISEDTGYQASRTGTIELHGVEFVDEPSCGGGSLVNGDFEGSAPGWWDAMQPTNDDLPTSTIESESDGMSGTNQFVRLRMHKVCSDAGIAQHAAVPEEATHLRFRYRTSPGQSESGRVQYGFDFGQTLTPTDTWTEVNLCLPVLPENDGLSIEFVLAGGGSCANSTPDYLDIDDVELVSDAACTPPVFTPGT